MTFPPTFVLLLAVLPAFVSASADSEYTDRQLVKSREMRIAISGEILSQRDKFPEDYIYYRVENPKKGGVGTASHGGFILQDSSWFYGYLFVNDEAGYSDFYTAKPLLDVLIMDKYVQSAMRVYMEDMAVFQDSDFNFTVQNDLILLKVSVTLFCSGYAGANCHIECPEYNPETEVCDPVDGIIKTKTYDGLNNCSNDFCHNQGICYLTPTKGDKKCACLAGFMGHYCEKEVCPFGCDPNRGFCLNNGNCVCFVGYSGRNCSKSICDDSSTCYNGGKCHIINNVHVCDCDRTRYAGNLCQYLCEPRCTTGVCIMLGASPACLVEEDEHNGTIRPPEPTKLADRLPILGVEIFVGATTLVAVVSITLLLCMRKYYNDLGRFQNKVARGILDTRKNQMERVGGAVTLIASKM